ncbi:ATP-binding protein [Actinocorallia longicatena]|uniref:NB-ARC domain-containing protein n=1 Tax=Actinocorallia longicatena TaxID=111803 RepID=A0ABP6QMV1_9ACTN
MLDDGGRSERAQRPIVWGTAAAVTMFTTSAAGWASISSVGWFQLTAAALASMAAGTVTYRETVNYRDRQRAAPPAAPAAPRPESLPGTITDFTGRAPEIDELVELFAGTPEHNPQAVVISALAGKGGVGKTRLAVHVAHLIKLAYPDGQLYVNLRGAEAESLDPSAVLSEFLVELGVPYSAIPEGVDARARRYRAALADRRILIVLDNARDEAQIRPLLPGDPSCSVLITSRSRLGGLDGVALMVLDVMAERDALSLLTSMAGAARTAAEPAEALRIVQLCGLLPLAVRVVGAQLAGRPGQTLRWSAERLTDERTRLRLLRAGDIEVRSSLALSYPRQPEPVRQAFRLLGLLRSADIPVWGLAALADRTAAEAEELCETLIDAGLLDPPDEDTSHQLRYRMHDLLRLLAQEFVAAEEGDPSLFVLRLLTVELNAARHAARLLDHEVADVDAADLAWLDRVGIAQAIEDDPVRWLRLEDANLVLGVEQAVQNGHWAIACDLAVALTDFFDTESRWDEWERSHLLAVSAARSLGDRTREADLLWRLGRRYRHGEPAQALTAYGDAVALYRGLGDRAGEAKVLLESGVVHREQGDLADARADYATCLAIFVELGDRRCTAYALRRLAFVETDQAEIAAAIDHFEECLPILRELGDTRWLGRTLRGLSIAQRLLARHADAEESATEALRSFQDTGDRRGEGYALLDLGGVRAEQERFEEARQNLEDCIAHFHQIGDDRGRAYALLDLSSLDGRCGRYEQALTEAAAGLGLCVTVRDRRGQSWAGLCLADLAREQGDFAEALDRYDTCLAAFEELGDHVGLARLMLRRGIAEFGLGREQDGRESWNEALRLFAAAGMPEAPEVERWLARPLPAGRIRGGIGRLHYPLGIAPG